MIFDIFDIYLTKFIELLLFVDRIVWLFAVMVD